MKRLLCVMMMVLVLTTGAVFAQGAPPVDRTGVMYELSRKVVDGDTFYLMMYWDQPPATGGVEFTAYLTVVLFKNADRANPLVKVSLALDNLGIQSKPFQERWDAFINRLVLAIEAYDIAGATETEEEMAWRMVFTLALVMNGNNVLSIEVQGG